MALTRETDSFAGVAEAVAVLLFFPVVNDQENGALMGSPALSLAPLTVAVYFVE